jgi:ketosteroid isomerase-like protein
MRFLVSLLLLSALLYSCGPEKPKSLSDDQIKKEKQEVQNVIEQYHKAYDEKSMNKLTELLSRDPIFFGTDSSEIIKSLPAFKEAMEAQWKIFKEEKFGTIADISIQMDERANFASIIYGMPCDRIGFDGNIEHKFLRYTKILKKEGNKWLIVSGIAGATTHGQSNQDLLKSNAGAEPAK